jgi:hypothetical protein
VKKEKIFSGDNSRTLWEYINRVADGTIDDACEALYLMGCKCQELEAVVDRLEERIDLLNEE